MIPGVLAQLSIVAEEIPPEGEEQVVFLSGFEGVDASTSPMVDESTFEHVMTFNGNVELDTAQKKFGASSLESVISIGTADYISVPNHTCFHFGDGDFTIEGFARSASLTGPHNFVSLGTSPDLSFRALLTESFSNDVLQFSYSVDGTAVVNVTSSTLSLAVNTWYHWAFVRNNLGPGDDTLYFFIDGVGFGAGSLNQDALFASTDDFIINGRGDGLEGHRGHIDEVRVLNYAAYTANFTPPAAPFDRPPSGVLSGTTALTFTAAATLAGSAALAGASALTFTPAADLTIAAEGELSGSSDLTFTVAGNLAITSVARYWRINIASTLDGNYISCAEVKCSLTHGGANMARGTATGTPTVSSQTGGNGAVAGSDLNPYTSWITASGVTGWLQWQFTSTTADIRNVLIISQDSGGENVRSPKDFTIEYSDNGSSWTVAATVTGETGWGFTETRRFAVPSSGAHEYWRINVTAVDGGSILEFGDIVFMDNTNGIMQSVEKAVVRGDSDFGSGNQAQLVLDGSTATGWTNNNLVGGVDHLVFDFGCNVALREMKWTSRTSEGGRSPLTGTIQYSHDNSSWTTVYTISEAGWGSLEERTWQW